MEIKIKCSHCGKILRLADTPNINNAVFTCPVCKEKDKVGNCQRITDVPKQEIANEETQYSFSSFAHSDDKTQIIGDSLLQPKIGTLVDNNGLTYKLHLGVSTIGRKATTSIAYVQIYTDDRTMSRNHAIIEVKMEGGQTFHIFRHTVGKNPSYVNGVILQTNDKIILNDGDRIKMGETELTFKK